MTSSDILIISPLLCKNITAQTTEEISKSNLYNFFTTTIQSNDIEIQIDDKIFYYYIEESKIYEIYIVNVSNKYIHTQASIFQYYYKENSTNSIDLFITNEYFSIYKNSKLYFFKENKNYEIEDIKSFVKHKYKLQINNIYIINQKQIEKYQNEFINKNKEYISYLKPKQSKWSLYYIIYLFVLLVGLVTYESYLKPIQQSKHTVKKEIKYTSNKDILYDIIKLCNIYNIQIEKLNYNTNKYELQIVSSNKKNIDKFITYYKNNIKIKNIYKNDKQYILEFDIAN